MPYRYKKNITSDNQEFLFAGLGITNVFPLNLTLPEFVNAPLVVIYQAEGDAIINLYQAPTATGFKIIIGSVGLVPSVDNPIPFWFEIISQDEEEIAEESAALVTNAWVKERFPQWQTLCTRADGLKTADEMLTLAIEQASIDFSAFFDSLTADDMTNEYKMHLLKIIKHVIFGFMHGDSEFKTPPQIEKDYEDTLGLLRGGLIGAETIQITAKERLFEPGEWFTDDDELQ